MHNFAKHYVRSFTQWKILIRDRNVILTKICYPHSTTAESAQTKKFANSNFERG